MRKYDDFGRFGKAGGADRRTEQAGRRGKGLGDEFDEKGVIALCDLRGAGVVYEFCRNGEAVDQCGGAFDGVLAIDGKSRIFEEILG